MARIGKYCKAYYVAKLREFSGWNENQGFIRETAAVSENADNAAGRLNEADFLYLQEDYTVTRGVFADEEFVFTDMTPAWTEFCRNTLNFEPPEHESAMPAVSEDVK